MPSKMYNEITYSFPNFNRFMFKSFDRISNSILHFKMNVTTYLFWIVFNRFYQYRPKEWDQDTIYQHCY